MDGQLEEALLMENLQQWAPSEHRRQLDLLIEHVIEETMAASEEVSPRTPTSS